MNYQLVQEVMLPGLRCLKHDMALIAPEHEEVVSSMIKEYESKIETSRPADRCAFHFLNHVFVQKLLTSCQFFDASLSSLLINLEDFAYNYHVSPWFENGAARLQYLRNVKLFEPILLKRMLPFIAIYIFRNLSTFVEVTTKVHVILDFPSYI